MARVKRGTVRAKKRRKLFGQTKGYHTGRKNLVRQARTAVKKSGQRAYDHRKLKKRTRRALWQIQISAASKALGISYSKLMGQFKKKNVEVDRKILAQIAQDHPEVFAKLVAEAKTAK